MLRLKEIRIKNGISQKDLADFLGVSRVTVSRYENEKRMLDQDLIIKISLYLDVTTDELLGFDEAYKKYSDYLISLTNKDVIN